MRRICNLLMLALMINISALAADFKIGEIKYEVINGDLVSVKDAKKAAGDVEIPAKVTDPKSGKEYTVALIAKGAFKKAPLTSITLPNTLQAIDEQAFKECVNLATAKLPDNVIYIPSECFNGCISLANVELSDSVKYFGNFAFCGTAIKDVVIPPSTMAIEFRAFSSCPKLQTVDIQAGPTPLLLNAGVFYESPINTAIIMRDLSFPSTEHILDKYRLYNNNPDLEKLVIGANVNTEGWKDALADCPKATLVFENEKAYTQALNVLKSIAEWQNAKGAYGYYHLLGDAESYYYNIMKRTGKNYNIPPFEASRKGEKILFAPTVVLGLDSPNKLQGANAIVAVYDNRLLEEFLPKMERFVEVAIENPFGLQTEYGYFSEYESVRFNEYIINTIRVLCDEEYFTKPTLSKDEVKALGGFINNYLMGIGADYGKPNMTLEKWAQNDILTKDLANGDHKDEYERILKAIDRYYNYTDKKSDPYHPAMQLAALCGLERWKEAAEYYPTVCRIIRKYSEYNQGELPYEMTYMQKAINDHGYKAVTPAFGTSSKTSKGKKQSASAKSKDDDSLLQFFMEAAINAGVEHYKEKKRKKEAQEMFYESLGLDKKGRPKKKK